MVELTEAQKYQVIRVLKEMAGADRNFNLQEANRIRIIGFRLDLSENKINEALAEDYAPLKTYFEHFTDSGQQRFVYQQAFWLLMSDEEFHDAESAALAELRQGFGISQAFHDEVKAWIQEGLAWEKRGRDMIE